MSLIVDEHRKYLSDQARVSCFQRAIESVVKPGDVVLDLGTGTGILGLLACRAGAARVYSVEAGGMIEVARRICRANGFEDRITYVRGLSTQVELPEKVDVVVCDQIGRFGFEAGLPEYLGDAWRRFLKPGGVTIPGRVELWVAPVEAPELSGQVEFWNNSRTGFDLHPAREMAANTGYPTKLVPGQLLGEPAAIASLEASTAKAIIGNASLVIERAGVVHGVGGWFSAQLAADVVMTNSPLAADAINRSNVFFPIDEPQEVEPGDEVRVRMHIIPAETVVTWNVEVWGPAGRKAAFTHSTWKGMLMCKEDLERTRPEFVPRLTARGEARRSVLELCDGQRTLAEVEQEVYQRHQPLFCSPKDAAVFVTEVVSRYSL